MVLTRAMAAKLKMREEEEEAQREGEEDDSDGAPDGNSSVSDTSQPDQQQQQQQQQQHSSSSRETTPDEGEESRDTSPERTVLPESPTSTSSHNSSSSSSPDSPRRSSHSASASGADSAADSDSPRLVPLPDSRSPSVSSDFSTSSASTSTSHSSSTSPPPPTHPHPHRPPPCSTSCICIIVVLGIITAIIFAAILRPEDPPLPAPPCHVHDNPNLLISCRHASVFNRILPSLPKFAPEILNGAWFQRRMRPSLNSIYLRDIDEALEKLEANMTIWNGRDGMRSAVSEAWRMVAGLTEYTSGAIIAPPRVLPRWIAWILHEPLQDMNRRVALGMIIWEFAFGPILEQPSFQSLLAHFHDAVTARQEELYSIVQTIDDQLSSIEQRSGNTTLAEVTLWLQHIELELALLQATFFILHQYASAQEPFLRRLQQEVIRDLRRELITVPALNITNDSTWKEMFTLLTQVYNETSPDPRPFQRIAKLSHSWQDMHHRITKDVLQKAVFAARRKYAAEVLDRCVSHSSNTSNPWTTAAEWGGVGCDTHPSEWQRLHWWNSSTAVLELEANKQEYSLLRDGVFDSLPPGLLHISRLSWREKRALKSKGWIKAIQGWRQEVCLGWNEVIEGVDTLGEERKIEEGDDKLWCI